MSGGGGEESFKVLILLVIKQVVRSKRILMPGMKLSVKYSINVTKSSI